MTSLSLCIIVKDEEDFLEYCLNSVKDYVDEIIIVDTGSTDKTIDIAKKFTDKVYKHEWPNDFSKARNISLRYATKEWILVLDADEIISDEDLKKIRKLIEDKDVDGFIMTQRNYTNNSNWINLVRCSKKDEYTKGFNGYRPSKLIRLFRNKKGFEFRNKVHELVEYSIEEKNGNGKETDIQIHHYNDARDENIKKKKAKKYFELGEEIIKKNPNDIRAYYQTGIFCFNNKDYKKAVEKFKKVIGLDPDYKNVYYNLGSAYHSLNKFDEAEKMLKKSIETKPRITAAYNLLGKILFDQKKIKEAVDLLLKGIQINKKDIQLYNTLGGILISINKPDKAIKILKTGITIAPNEINLYNNLGGAYLIKNDFENAVEILNKALEMNPNKFITYKNLFVVYMKKGDKEKAIRLLEKAIEIFPKYKNTLEKYISNIS